MASAIDATQPQDGVPASKSQLRANLLAAKSEIEDLQTRTRLVISNRASSTVSVTDADEQNYLVLQPGVTTLEMPDGLALGVIINGVNESGGAVNVVAKGGGSTVFAGASSLPDDAPWSAIKTAAAKIRVIVGG
jgi:hypothetical protein